ncbi:MAG: hypothetical protein K6F53_11415 [Lachnospiraceae bacterium]|nr:hypothetical protein [Lachnospiraceae bacterium]
MQTRLFTRSIAYLRGFCLLTAVLLLLSGCGVLSGIGKSGDGAGSDTSKEESGGTKNPAPGNFGSENAGGSSSGSSWDFSGKEKKYPKVTHDNLPKKDYIGRDDDLLAVNPEALEALIRNNAEYPQINWDHMYSLKGHEEVIVCSEAFRYEDQTYVLFAIENTGKKEILADADIYVVDAKGDVAGAYSTTGYRVGAENGTYSLLYLFDYESRDFNIRYYLNGYYYPADPEYDFEYEVEDDFDLSNPDYITYHFRITNTGPKSFRLGGENVYVLDKKGDVIGFREKMYEASNYENGHNLKHGESFEDAMIFYGLNDKRKQIGAALFCSYTDFVEGEEEPGPETVEHGNK